MLGERYLHGHDFALKYRSSVLWIALAFAVAASSCSTPSEADDAQAIRSELLSSWNRPYVPLKVDPIVIAGEYAIATWVQGHYAGRVLLERQQGAWQMILCSGDALKDPDFLQEAGVDPVAARTLVADLHRAEQSLPARTRAALSRFRGVVPMR